MFRRIGIVALYVIVPLCLFFWFNLQVSYKYEVDHQKTFVAIDDKLTPLEKADIYKELSVLEKDIKRQSNFMLLGAAVAFFLATILVMSTTEEP
ncbi:hypothetical protein GCM10023188_48490 [Pontibacter saemangeumensis]|uniref:Uncharacterized protein n=1 Tax=Pontibacter saemangeumensis TaxID=1084525 RepID=A0ABP8MAJ8_9BACT